MKINLCELLDYHKRRRPGDVALKTDKLTTTYNDLNERVNSLADSLLDLGVEKGDKIALISKNRPEYVESIFAFCKIGAIGVYPNWRQEPATIEFCLSQTDTRHIVSENQFIEKLDEETKSELGVRIALDGDQSGWKDYSRLVEERMGESVQNEEGKIDTLTRIIFTAGTTGRPKSVPITYRNQYFKMLAHLIDHQITSDDILFSTFPLFHVGGFEMTSLNVLAAGGLVIMRREWDTGEYVGVVEKEEPTIIGAVPTVLNGILKLPDIESHDLSSVRLILDGGEAIKEPQIKDIKKAFPNARFAYGYGLSETTSGDTFLPRGKELEKAGSAGIPLPFLHASIVDEGGEEVPVNEEGEIALKGPKIIDRYYEMPEETEESFTEDGWFLTGDMGRVDEDGYLFFTDRKKDIIVSGGENISSLELENVIASHPKVKECAVVAAPHEKWGESPAAYIVPKEGETVKEEEIERHCREKLASFKIPKYWRIVAGVPKSSVGKILKRELREKIQSELEE